jgi:hypothetical protein
MTLFSTRAEDVEELESGGARVVCYRVGDSTLVTRASGHARLEHIEVLIRRSDELIARAGRIDVVHDWFEVTGYRAEIRKRMTPWAIRTRAQHRSIHIGAKSSLVQMGVTLIRLASGAPIRAYTTEHELELAMAGLLRMSARP